MLQQNIQDLITAGELDKALEALNDLVKTRPDDDDALFNRGRVLWRMGRRHEAMTDYAAAVELNPQSPAAIALQQATDVFDFYNHDLYNP